MKITVIGAGYWGNNIIRCLDKLGYLHNVIDINDDLIDDSIAAVIATPSNTHYTICKQMLLANKHVLVEKPFTLNYAEAEELVELANARNRILMVGHLMQYHPCFIKLKEMDIDIIQIISQRLNLGIYRGIENVLMSFAPHDISMILSLMNSMPTDIVTIGDRNTMVSKLVFGNILATIFVSWLYPVKEQKLTIVGTDNIIVFDDTMPWDRKLVVYDYENKGIEGFVKKDSKAVIVEPAEPLIIELEHFAKSILNNVQPVTNGTEALNVMKVLCNDS